MKKENCNGIFEALEELPNKRNFDRQFTPDLIKIKSKFGMFDLNVGIDLNIANTVGNIEETIYSEINNNSDRCIVIKVDNDNVYDTFNKKTRIIKYLKKVVLNFEPRIHETLCDAVIKFTIDVNFKELVLSDKFKNTFNSRDDIKLIIIINGEEIIEFNIEDETYEEAITKFLDGFFDEDEMECTIKITKNIIDSRISLYSMESFEDCLKKMCTLDILKMFSNTMNNSPAGIVIEVYDDINVTESNSIKFVKYDSVINTVFQQSRDVYFEAIPSFVLFNGIPEIAVVPEDFDILGNYDNRYITKLFTELKSILSIIYISNRSWIEDDIIHYQINGQRLVAQSIDSNKILENIYIFNISKWIYQDKFSSDKLLLARSVLSLNCKFETIDKIDLQTYSAIVSTHNIYLKENIDTYITLKQEVTKYITELMIKINDHALHIYDKFKSNILIIGAYIVTIVLNNMMSAAPINNIFNREITIITELIICVSFVFLIMTCLEMKSNIKK